jgi:hypothetical protein
VTRLGAGRFGNSGYISDRGRYFSLFNSIQTGLVPRNILFHWCHCFSPRCKPGGAWILQFTIQRVWECVELYLHRTLRPYTMALHRIQREFYVHTPRMLVSVLWDKSFSAQTYFLLSCLSCMRLFISNLHCIHWEYGKYCRKYKNIFSKKSSLRFFLKRWSCYQFIADTYQINTTEIDLVE